MPRNVNYEIFKIQSIDPALETVDAQTLRESQDEVMANQNDNTNQIETSIEENTVIQQEYITLGNIQKGDPVGVYNGYGLGMCEVFLPIYNKKTDNKSVSFLEFDPENEYYLKYWVENTVKYLQVVKPDGTYENLKNLTPISNAIVITGDIISVENCGAQSSIISDNSDFYAVTLNNGVLTAGARVAYSTLGISTLNGLNGATNKAIITYNEANPSYLISSIKARGLVINIATAAITYGAEQTVSFTKATDFAITSSSYNISSCIKCVGALDDTLLWVAAANDNPGGYFSYAYAVFATTVNNDGSLSFGNRIQMTYGYGLNAATINKLASGQILFSAHRFYPPSEWFYYYGVITITNAPGTSGNWAQYSGLSGANYGIPSSFKYYKDNVWWSPNIIDKVNRVMSLTATAKPYNSANYTDYTLVKKVTNTTNYINVFRGKLSTNGVFYFLEFTYGLDATNQRHGVIGNGSDFVAGKNFIGASSPVYIGISKENKKHGELVKTLIQVPGRANVLYENAFTIGSYIGTTSNLDFTNATKNMVVLNSKDGLFTGSL